MDSGIYSQSEEKLGKVAHKSDSYNIVVHAQQRPQSKDQRII